MAARGGDVGGEGHRRAGHAGRDDVRVPVQVDARVLVGATKDEARGSLARASPRRAAGGPAARSARGAAALAGCPAADVHTARAPAARVRPPPRRRTSCLLARSRCPSSSSRSGSPGFLLRRRPAARLADVTDAGVLVCNECDPGVRVARRRPGAAAGSRPCRSSRRRTSRRSRPRPPRSSPAPRAPRPRWASSPARSCALARTRTSRRCT